MKNYYNFYARLWPYYAKYYALFVASGVCRIFERGVRGAGNLRIMHSKKISPLRISSFFCPKLGEEQKQKKFFTQI